MFHSLLYLQQLACACYITRGPCIFVDSLTEEDRGLRSWKLSSGPGPWKCMACLVGIVLPSLFQADTSLIISSQKTVKNSWMRTWSKVASLSELQCWAPESSFLNSFILLQTSNKQQLAEITATSGGRDIYQFSRAWGPPAWVGASWRKGPRLSPTQHPKQFSAQAKVSEMAIHYSLPLSPLHLPPYTL